MPLTGLPDLSNLLGMAIQSAPSPAKLHWNYFLALERDMETVARYVEFAKDNFETYSIELAHLLFAAASEVDVLCRQFCEDIKPSVKDERRNIHTFRKMLTKARPKIGTEQVFVRRFGLVLTLGDSWADPKKDPPEWWEAYNKVKHERGTHFKQATLKNALNALAALLIMFFYHRCHVANKTGFLISDQDITREFHPGSTLLRLDNWYYHETMVGGG